MQEGELVSPRMIEEQKKSPSCQRLSEARRLAVSFMTMAEQNKPPSRHRISHLPQELIQEAVLVSHKMMAGQMPEYGCDCTAAVAEQVSKFPEHLSSAAGTDARRRACLS